MSTIEVKIRKLDGELGRYKEQMSKLRPGPGKVHPLPHLHTPHRRSTNPHLGRDPAARAAHAEAEAHVRGADRAAHAADVQHGERRARDGQPAQHDGDRRRDAGREQGDAPPVREDRHRQDRGACVLWVGCGCVLMGVWGGVEYAL